MRTSIAALITSGVLGVSLTACVQPNDDPHPFARALPTAAEVKIDLPDATSGAAE